MAYTKQNFVSGQVLKAEHMNNIENGIVQNEESINTINNTLVNKSNIDHTHSNYLSSVPSDYKTKTENDALYQPIGDYVNPDNLPTKTSQLTNDSGFVDDTYVTNAISEAQLSGGEVDLSGYALKTELPTAVSQLTNDVKYIKRGEDYSVKNIVGYNSNIDLFNSFQDGNGIYVNKNFDNIPITDDSGTTIGTSKRYDIFVYSTYSSLLDCYLFKISPTDGTITRYHIVNMNCTETSTYALTSDIPTAISQLTNDSNFVDETYVTNAISEAQLSGGGTGNISSDTINTIMVVDTLPEVEEEGVLYLVKESTSIITNMFTGSNTMTSSSGSEYTSPKSRYGITYTFSSGTPTILTDGTTTSNSVQGFKQTNVLEAGKTYKIYVDNIQGDVNLGTYEYAFNLMIKDTYSSSSSYAKYFVANTGTQPSSDYTFSPTNDITEWYLMIQQRSREVTLTNYSFDVHVEEVV